MTYLANRAGPKVQGGKSHQKLPQLIAAFHSIFEKFKETHLSILTINYQILDVCTTNLQFLIKSECLYTLPSLKLPVFVFLKYNGVKYD